MSGTKPLDGGAARPPRTGPQDAPAQPALPQDEVRHAAARLESLLAHGAGAKEPTRGPAPAGAAPATTAAGDGAAADARPGAEALSAPAIPADAGRLLAFLGGAAPAPDRRAEESLPAAGAHADGLPVCGELAHPKLARREGEGTGGDDADGGDEGAPDPAIALGGAAPAADPLLAFVDAPAPTQPATRSAEMVELVDKLAERVLVGQRADGNTEIRVTLRHDLLGGAEVRIARVDGGLELRIDAPSEDALRTLRAHGDDLVQSLSERLDGRVTLQVTAQPRTDEQAQHRRSAGYDDILTYVADRQ